MLEEGGAKPFWLTPPWSILFDLLGLEKVRLWDVDLTFLLTSLLVELKKRGLTNFSIPGIALLSSATIYRRKSEVLLKLEEPPQMPSEKPRFEGPIPILDLPFRYEYASLTLEDMLAAIKAILSSAPMERLKGRGEALISEEASYLLTLPSPDPFLVEVEEVIEALRLRLVEALASKSSLTFSEVIAGCVRREAVRIFIALLFLACQGKVYLWQEEGSLDVLIALHEVVGDA